MTTKIKRILFPDPERLAKSPPVMGMLVFVVAVVETVERIAASVQRYAGGRRLHVVDDDPELIAADLEDMESAFGDEERSLSDEVDDALRELRERAA
jgi:hypothetical protein